MGQTIIEKIFAAHSKDDIKPGKIIWLDLDVRSARDFGGANVIANLRKYYPNEEKLENKAKTVFTFDTVVPAKNVGYAENQQIIRDFAREEGIRVFDSEWGIGSHILIEEGYCVPGATVVGTDSHLNIMGCIGAFGQGMGDQDIAFGMKAGKTWFEVPPTMKVIIEGELQPPCSAKDLTLAIIRKLTSKGALGKAIEFEGKAIEKLSFAGRITLASMVTEMGGIIGFIPPNEEIISYSKARAKSDFTPYFADEDAKYVEEVVVDISDLRPLIAKPYKPDNVVEVASLEKEKIHVDSAFLGSCTNGRYEDIKVAVDMLKGIEVAKDTVMKIVPATRRVLGDLIKNGDLQVLFEARTVVSNPGCAGCASGQIGMTGKGEVQVSTGNRNFKGKQGSGMTYLCSPETVTASAITGYITSPENI
ncbi:homoaconitate hydratase family protein [Candidatus Heimdallarchaeota archaeon]|nr:MAG: homoaconitate hydratase family protein [Candidatus Heimdallarchaeota archaeon]RLI69577.1 MAG: homoaconitate hydratase family protein [Candidatus Gerdarchaeota archaeon]RLI70124.1 MAG: homoaconitate hydratase family protein [Candidatus Gerdarchaeota archaeon]